MISTPKEMTYEKWLDGFQPVINSLATNAPFDGLMFETFGAELDYVRSMPARQVWTLVEGDENELIIIGGYHLVNRIGYFITDQPWQDNETIEVLVG